MKRFLITLIILLLVPITVLAQEDYNSYLESFDLSAFEELDKETLDFIDELGLSDFDYENLTSISLKDIFNYIYSVLVHRSKGPIKAGLTVICFVIISSLFRSFGNEVNKGNMSSFFSTITSLVISVFLIVQITECLSLCCTTIKLCSNFAFAFFPVFCLIVATSGGGLTSFSVNTMLLMLAQGLNALAELVFIPLTNCFLALGICSGLRDELNLNGLLQFIRKIITTSISTLSAVFLSVLSVKTAVSSRTDALGLRSVRFAINTVVPVIGSSISEGLLSIQSYSGLIKTSVGVVGIIAVSAVFLPSIVEVTIWRAVLAAAQICTNVFDDSYSSKTVSAFGDVLLIVNVVLILCMVTTIISIGILIAAKTGM